MKPDAFVKTVAREKVHPKGDRELVAMPDRQSTRTDRLSTWNAPHVSQQAKSRKKRSCRSTMAAPNGMLRRRCTHGNHGPVTRKILLLLSVISFSAAFVLHESQTSLQLHCCQQHLSASTIDTDENKVAVQSQLLGDIIKLDKDDDDSFLGAMQVPTFASLSKTSISTPSDDTKARGLEGVLQQGPAFVLDNVLSKETCQELIQMCESAGFGSYNAGKNHHGALQLVVSQETADSVATTLSRHVDISQVERNTNGDEHLLVVGLNRRWRIYKYAPGGEETFAPHIDAGFPPSGLDENNMTLVWDDSPPNQQVVSRLTVLMYLNDDFVGGETRFYQPVAQVKGDTPPPLIASVRPVAGSLLVFPQAIGEDAVEYARQHWPLHEGASVVSGEPKYVIRSDVLFATQPQDSIRQEEQQLFQHDAVVRQAFLPRSPALDRTFLSHLSSLYNPHMGVENIGTFLYSFVRFTKVKSIVEIGSGYTSLWILQALKDNADELDRIRSLQRQGKCRLLDWPWTVPEVVEHYDDSPSSLLCIDNCLHQKETATGAAAVAKTLGLDSFMKFVRGDAFELDLKDESIDLLWCDFGVGSRMQEFVSRAWSSIRPGGFLLCHSTLTNQRTRDWLEAARSRKGQAETGMPLDEYVEVSLLEPHKQYQNSVSIFQKRKGYEEPLYSEYA